MNFQETLKKLQNSDEFKKFKKENKKAFLCSAFFVLDYETNENTQQLDFFLPKQNKMAVFAVNGGIEMRTEKIFGEHKNEIKELDTKIKAEVENIEKIAKKESEQKIKKIIAIIQQHEGKQIWNLTCMLQTLSLLRIHIDCKTSEILKKETNSLFDFVKKI